MMSRLGPYSSIVAGPLIFAGQTLYWLVVPHGAVEQEQHQAVAVLTGVTWFVGFLAVLPAMLATHDRYLRPARTLGGAAAGLTVLGAVGLACAAGLVAPGVTGLEIDSVTSARRALTLQAVAELSATAFVAGVLLVGLTSAFAGRMPKAASILLSAGAVIASAGLEEHALWPLSAALVGTAFVLLGLALKQEMNRGGGHGDLLKPRRQLRASSFWNSPPGPQAPGDSGA